MGSITRVQCLNETSDYKLVEHAKVGKWLIECLKPDCLDTKRDTFLKIFKIAVLVFACLILALPTTGLSLIIPACYLYQGNKAIKLEKSILSDANITPKNTVKRLFLIKSNLLIAFYKKDDEKFLNILTDHPDCLDYALQLPIRYNPIRCNNPNITSEFQDRILSKIISKISHIQDYEFDPQYFHTACSKGFLLTIKKIIKKDLVDLTVRSKDNLSCLESTIWGYGTDDYRKKTIEARVSIAKLLIEKRPSLLKKTQHSDQSLLNLAKFRNENLMIQLIEEKIS